MKLGKEMLETKNYNDSITYLDKAIEINSNDPSVWNLKGDCFNLDLFS